MKQENDFHRIDTEAAADMVSRFTSGKRRGPTIIELASARAILDDEVELIENLYENNEFDPDVVAIYMGVYDDRLKWQESTSGQFPLYVFSLYLTALCATNSLNRFQEGHTTQGELDLAAALLLSTIPLYLDFVARGEYSRELVQTVRAHFPPIYSPYALRQREDEAYTRGLDDALKISRIMKHYPLSEDNDPDI